MIHTIQLCTRMHFSQLVYVRQVIKETFPRNVAAAYQVVVSALIAICQL